MFAYSDGAYKLSCEGTALLWRGDFQNAKLLMQALSRRIVRVFGKVTLSACFRNGVNNARTLDMLEPVQFLSKELSAANSQWNSCHDGDSLSLQTSVQGLQ